MGMKCKGLYMQIWSKKFGENLLYRSKFFDFEFRG